jgi:hypothetical protein
VEKALAPYKRCACGTSIGLATIRADLMAAGPRTDGLSPGRIQTDKGTEMQSQFF